MVHVLRCLFWVRLLPAAPADKLTLSRDDDELKLMSEDYGISVGGLAENLPQLNALVVPAPPLIAIGKEVYITLSPVLRCRWKEDVPQGPWTATFSLANVDSVQPNLARRVSVLRLPENDDQWEVLGREVAAEHEAPDEEITVEVSVDHFSDLVVAINNANHDEEDLGYLIVPRLVAVPRVFKKMVSAYRMVPKVSSISVYIC